MRKKCCSCRKWFSREDAGVWIVEKKPSEENGLQTRGLFICNHCLAKADMPEIKK